MVRLAGGGRSGPIAGGLITVRDGLHGGLGAVEGGGHRLANVDVQGVHFAASFTSAQKLSTKVGSNDCIITDAGNIAGTQAAACNDWRVVSRFHVGTGHTEPTQDTG